jgi:hypothetical protein
MGGIAKKIFPVYVVDINAIGVKPTHRPRVSRGEPKTAVLKTSRSAGEIGAVHVERVATAKTGAEAVVGNPAVAGRRLRSVSLLLSLRRPGLLLRALLLRRWLSLLLGAWLLLRWLSLLLRAWLLLYRLSLLLRRLLLRRRLSLLLLLLRLLLLLALLCVSGRNGARKQEQTCYSQNFAYLH